MIRRELVEAGAGCGKTYSLVERYFEAIEQQKFNPRDIIVLTFSEEAANEMRNRILDKASLTAQEQLSQEIIEEGQIRTFHSLCFSLLKPKLYELGYSSNSILPSGLALHLRRRWIKGQLSTHPKIASLLSHFQFSELVELCLDLWFNTKTMRAIDEEILSQKKLFDAFIQESIKELEDALKTLSRKSEATLWMPAFLASLQYPFDSELCASIDFRRGTGLRKFNQDWAALYTKAKSWKECVKQQINLYFEANTYTKDLEVQKEVYSLVQELKDKQKKLQSKSLDFQALEYELINLISNNVDILPQKPKLLIVDEFQDTNPNQYKIIESLSSATTQWYFVGDPKQSIYRFRGADISIFMKVKNEIQLLSLENNYRSEPAILQFSNAVQTELFSSRLPHNPNPQTLKPKRDETVSGPQILIRQFANKIEMNSYQQLIVDLKQNLKVSTFKNKTHGILLPNWSAVHEVSQLLTQEKITHAISGENSYLNHHLSFCFADFLEWANYPETTETFCSFYRWSLMPEESWPSSPIDLECKAQSIHQEFKLKFAGFPHLPPSTLFSIFNSFIQSTRWPQGAQWLAQMERAVTEIDKMIASHSLSTDEVIQYLRKELPFEELFENPLLPIEAAKRVDHKITLLTIHGSKGLQYDFVYLPKLDWRHSSLRLRQDESEQDFVLAPKLQLSNKRWMRSLLHRKNDYAASLQIEAEKRRLLYVALTRAHSFLYLYKQPYLEKDEKIDIFHNILHWPKQNYLPWSFFIDAACRLESIQDLIQKNKIEVTNFESKSDTAEASNNASEQLWAIPAPLLKNADPQASQSAQFTRMGVSEYIQKQFPQHIIPIQKTTTASTNSAAEIGRQIHKILEFWNGELSTLKSTLEAASLSKAQSKQAYNMLCQLREHEDLQPYWNYLKQNPDQVYREFDLYILNQEYRLSGIIDLFWINPESQQMTIVDWKTTSSSLKTLKSEDRMKKLQLQLELYASAMKARYNSIRLMAFGISLNQDSIECEKIYDQSV